MSVVLAEVFDTLEWFVLHDVTEHLWEVEAFLDASVGAVLFSDVIDGFLKRPLTEGFLAGAGRTAKVLAPDFGT